MAVAKSGNSQREYREKSERREFFLIFAEFVPFA